MGCGKLILVGIFLFKLVKNVIFIKWVVLGVNIFDVLIDCLVWVEDFLKEGVAIVVE